MKNAKQIYRKRVALPMPTISMFYGILIKMFFVDTDKHHVPHIHAEYQGESAVFSIPDGELLAGNLSNKKKKLVIAWIEIHEEDLLADWELAVNGKTPFPIRGLRPMKIVKVTPQKNYILRIESEDGRCGDFDVKPYLDYEAFTPLKEIASFNRVRNGGYYIEWDCGADLSADTIEAHWNILVS